MASGFQSNTYSATIHYRLIPHAVKYFAAVKVQTRKILLVKLKKKGMFFTSVEHHHNLDLKTLM